MLVLLSYVLGPTPSAILVGRGSDDPHRHPHDIADDDKWAVGLVCRSVDADGLCDLRDDPLSIATPGAVNSGNNSLGILAPLRWQRIVLTTERDFFKSRRRFKRIWRHHVFFLTGKVK